MDCATSYAAGSTTPAAPTRHPPQNGVVRRRQKIGQLPRPGARPPSSRTVSQASSRIPLRDGCPGGVTGGHRAQAHIALKPPVTPQGTSLQLGPLNTAVLFHALAKFPRGAGGKGQVLRIFDRISSGSGKRSDSCLEKIFSPSTTTSKIPPAPQTNSDSTPISPLMVAAKLAAWGR